MERRKGLLRCLAPGVTGSLTEMHLQPEVTRQDCCSRFDDDWFHGFKPIAELLVRECHRYSLATAKLRVSGSGVRDGTSGGQCRSQVQEEKLYASELFQHILFPLRYCRQSSPIEKVQVLCVATLLLMPSAQDSWLRPVHAPTSSLPCQTRLHRP